MTRRRLADTLSVMLPAREQTSFLGACLLEGPALGAAWREWLGAVGDPVRFLRASGDDSRRHLALLYRNLTDNGEAIPSDLQPYLRAALVREQLRFETYDRCFQESVQILTVARIDLTVLKGAAVSRALFQSPFLRHCHDLDLWLTDEELPRALAVLVAHGFQDEGRRAGTTRLAHPKGLPVLLHTRLLDGPFYRMPRDEMRGRRRTANTPSGAFNMLAHPDMLAHLCAHASTANRRPHANWVIDAHRLSAQLTGADWETFLDVVRRADLALPVAVLLRYLRDALAARVPLSVIDGLAAAADRADGVTLMAALDGAWLGRPGGLGSMLLESSWRSRLSLARWLLLPPPAYLRATRGPMGPARLAAAYPMRPMRFLVRSVRRRSGHPSPGDRFVEPRRTAGELA